MLRKDGPAGELPISVADAVAHCRAPEDGSDDDLVENYLRAAIPYVADQSGLVLIRQDYILECTGWWSGCLEIPVYPVRDITAVKYWDANGVEQTVSPSLYRWVRTSNGAELRLLSTFSQPTLQDERTDVVRVFIEAGFDVEGMTGSGDEADLVFDPRARHAVLMLTDHWYENRSAVDNVAMNEVPFAVQSLIAQIRAYR